MSLVIQILYTGDADNARQFANEMTDTGIATKIRAQPGNLRYEYYAPLDDPHSILLIDEWEDQQALNTHHESPMMAEIARLRDKYDLHMSVARFRRDETVDTASDDKYVRS